MRDLSLRYKSCSRPDPKEGDQHGRETMEQIAIIGLGLMGASLGLGLKASGFGGRVVGYARRGETREFAKAHEMVDDVVESPIDAAKHSDLVVVCVPIVSIEGVIRDMLPGIKPGCILTDVGSTKAHLANRITSIVSEHHAFFIGSHPIAGSERHGVEAAVPDLYHLAKVVVTPPPEDQGRFPVDKLCRFWKGLGAEIIVMTPEQHDLILARTSHLPHMISATLASTVGRGPDGEEMARFCGAGVRDATRIAEGSPAIWIDILCTNRQNVLSELRAFHSILEQLIGIVSGQEDEVIESFLKQAQERRKQLVAEVEKKRDE